MSNYLKNLCILAIIFIGFFSPLISEPQVTSDTQQLVTSPENRFVVVIASYNNQEWVKQNLDSVFEQNYKNYRIIYIDDCSLDGTGQLVENYIKEKKRESQVTLIRNEKRVGALANHYKAIHLCDPSEICVILDGDDWLYHSAVLDRLNKEYSDPDVWMTYGQFMYKDGIKGWGEQLPQEYLESNRAREYLWVTTALRTFYAGLGQKIHKEDLYDEGDFFRITGDLALMFPIFEMAGKHSRFIPDILYVYNVTPQNDTILEKDKQFQTGLVIRKRTRYLPLTNRNDPPKYQGKSMLEALFAS